MDFFQNICLENKRINIICIHFDLDYTQLSADHSKCVTHKNL